MSLSILASHVALVNCYSVATPVPGSFRPLPQPTINKLIGSWSAPHSPPLPAPTPPRTTTCSWTRR
eukprot:scaffold107505_cov33-Tisochrysis_lutea.AAC.2